MENTVTLGLKTYHEFLELQNRKFAHTVAISYGLDGTIVNTDDAAMQLVLDENKILQKQLERANDKIKLHEAMEKTYEKRILKDKEINEKYFYVQLQNTSWKEIFKIKFGKFLDV